MIIISVNVSMLNFIESKYRTVLLTVDLEWRKAGCDLDVIKEGGATF